MSSRDPVVGVLAIQGDVREHLHSLRSVGADAIAVRSAADLERVDGLVVPGGESTTMSKLAILDGLLEPLQDARRAGMAMYGSCAGMIMLADSVLDARPDQQFIGGIDMVVRRNAFGRQVDSFEAGVDIPLLGDDAFPAVFIRAPWVERVGEDVEVLARVNRASDEGTIVAVRQGALLATAFHPELTGDARIHAMFVQMVQERKRATA